MTQVSELFFGKLRLRFRPARARTSIGAARLSRSALYFPIRAGVIASICMVSAPYFLEAASSKASSSDNGPLEGGVAELVPLGGRASANRWVRLPADGLGFSLGAGG